MRQTIFAVCLIAGLIGYGLQIRDYRRKPEQEKAPGALVKVVISGVVLLLLIVWNLFG